MPETLAGRVSAGGVLDGVSDGASGQAVRGSSSDLGQNLAPTAPGPRQYNEAPAQIAEDPARRSTLSSLTARLTIASLIWITLIIMGGTFLFSRLFNDYLTDAMDERLEQFLQSKIGVAYITPGGQLDFARQLGEMSFTEPYSGYYWQVVLPGQAPLRSRSLWDAVLEIDTSVQLLAPRFTFRTGPDGQYLRVLERDVRLPGASAPTRFIVTGNYEDVRAPLKRFHTSLLWGMGLLGLGLGLATILQIRYGLRPLRRLRRAVVEIRTGQSARVSPDLPPEVMPLVDEMNALLSQNEMTMERAKTQAGNLAHALKTPLSILTNESERQTSPLSQTVRRQVGLMRRHIDHNLARARAASHYGKTRLSCDGVEAAQAIVRVVQKLHRDKTIEMAGAAANADPLRAQISREDLEEILGNLIENAAKFSDTTVHISVRAVAFADQKVACVFTIADDGPGIPVDERDTIFARGRRLDESIPGTGLGLSIVEDLLDIYGGTISLGQSKDLGGLEAQMALPLALVAPTNAKNNPDAKG